MLYTIVIVREGRAGVVRRINEDASHFASELLLQRLEREQVVAKDEPIIEDVVLCHTLLGVVTLLRVFKQDARLQPRPVVFANPRQFKPLFTAHPQAFLVSFSYRDSLLRNWPKTLTANCIGTLIFAYSQFAIRVSVFDVGVKILPLGVSAHHPLVYALGYARILVNAAVVKLNFKSLAVGIVADTGYVARID
jgi:hypothetical protein